MREIVLADAPSGMVIVLGVVILVEWYAVVVVPSKHRAGDQPFSTGLSVVTLAATIGICTLPPLYIPTSHGYLAVLITVGDVWERGKNPTGVTPSIDE